MLGAIIGDIIGSAYEFSNTRDYNFKLFTHRSDFTDDSIMTIAVAHWAMHNPTFSHQSLEETMVRYAKAYPCPMGGYGGGFNTWLFHPDKLIDYTTGRPAGRRCPYNSWGNGSAMRVSSIGWIFNTLAETERVAAISAAITHNHPEGVKGAQAVAAAIYMARKGVSKEDMRYYVEKRFGYDLSTPWEELHRNYKWDSSCQGTVPQAIIAFLESADFEDAIRRAISMGGDSDTIGSITGGIAEAYYQSISQSIVVHAMNLLPEAFRGLLRELSVYHYAGCYDKYIKQNTACVQFTPEHIKSLKPNEIFVFGSNLAGHHGGGAAAAAHRYYGAEWGVGVGLTGRSYAIPTMQGGVETIQPYVDQFVDFAIAHPEYKFLVTKIGCGIAGFRVSEIAPLFRAALRVPNIVLPREFWEVL